MPLEDLDKLFTQLVCDRNTITSTQTIDYNCVAWALGIQNQWCEPFGVIVPAPPPDYCWTDHRPPDSLLSTYVTFFESHGFELSDDDVLEKGYAKVTIYLLDGMFTHVARQLSNGRWTSKIGKLEDIQHALAEIESPEDQPYGYGRASVFMKRRTQRKERQKASDFGLAAVTG